MYAAVIKYVLNIDIYAYNFRSSSTFDLLLSYVIHFGGYLFCYMIAVQGRNFGEKVGGSNS